MRVVKLIAVAAGLAAGGLASAAMAAEVKQDIEVKAAPAAVWKKIGAFCSIKSWHPAIANCEQSKVNGDTFRLLTLKDGGKIKEKFINSGNYSYTYSIVESPLPVSNYKATLSVKADGDGDKGESDVVWTAKFDPKDKPEAEAKGVIEGIFKAGLENIKVMVKADNEAAAKTKADRDAKINAVKVAALAKIAAAKAMIAEKSKQASESAKGAYEKAKAEIAAAQTPEAKAERASKLQAAKLVAAEKYAKAKLVIAEKAHQAAEAAKAAYEKAKASVSSATAPAPAPDAAKK